MLGVAYEARLRLQGSVAPSSSEVELEIVPRRISTRLLDLVSLMPLGLEESGRTNRPSPKESVAALNFANRDQPACCAI